MSARLSILLFLSLLCGAVHAQAPAAPLPVVMPPIPPSPISQFRQWLRLPAADREKPLADYTESKRMILRQKLQEYEAMSPEQRERRLQMLELRWYLRPLMSAAPEQRGDYHEMMPPRLHETITSRLEKWDALAPETRREMLANEDSRELVTRHFVQLRRTPVQAQDLHPLDAGQRALLQENLKRWNQTSPAQREKMGDHLATFFDLSRPDQDRALGQLSDAERQEMQKTLDAFAQLSSEHRRACVDSFQKFATMTPRERGAFLKNAARWQQMSVQDRETWRRLVSKLPPMPPTPIVIPPFPQTSLPAGETLAKSAGKS